MRHQIKAYVGDNLSIFAILYDNEENAVRSSHEASSLGIPL